MATNNKKSTTADLNPIATKVIEGLRQSMNSKIIDMMSWKKGVAEAESIAGKSPSFNALSHLDPNHAVYMHSMNTLSDYVESICQLPAVKKITDLYAKAEDEYMPGGPPMSPLTKTYFSCWGLLDLSVGKGRESFATIVLALCRYLKMDAHTIQVYQILAKSRMGFYMHEGVSGKIISFREIITNKEIKAICPAGYMGKKGEIWFTRIFPPPFESAAQYSIVFTTPYVIGEIESQNAFKTGSEKSWLEFFDRNLNKTKIADPVASYEHFMKYGLNPNYWSEYIFLSFVNFQSDKIWCAGFPDIQASMPHTDEGMKRLGMS
jgi:hypothetical protein